MPLLPLRGDRIRAALLEFYSHRRVSTAQCFPRQPMSRMSQADPADASLADSLPTLPLWRLSPGPGSDDLRGAFFLPGAGTHPTLPHWRNNKAKGQPVASCRIAASGTCSEGLLASLVGFPVYSARSFPDDPFLQVGPELRSQLRPRTEMRNALTLRDWGALTATFHYIFASWPEHFFAFLDALIRSRGGERRIESHEKRNLGPIGYELIYGGVSPPAFLFLREPYEDYLRTRFIGESRLPAAERYSVSHAQARDALDVFPDEVDGLIDHGFLRVARGPLRIQNKTFKSHIERESVERLRSEWKGLLPFHRVVALLGAGWSIMRMLREEEWLKPLRGPDIDGYPVDLYRSSEVDALLSAMALRTIATPYVAGESITLGALFTSRLAGMSAILEAILGGELIPADTGAAKPFFRRLALTRVQILRWRNASRIKCEGSLLLTQKEVAEVLGVSNHEVVRLVARGLLDKEGGEGPGLFFCWKAIETFCQTYVFLREARALLDVYPVTVSKYLRERNIQPVLGGNSAADRGVLLFRLEDICSLLVDKPIV